MIRIAVLGDIGSGKSHIAKLFGHPVFSADNEVSKLYRKNKRCYRKLKKSLPRYIFSFPVKKNELNKAILKNSQNIKKITKIVHPEIRFRMNSFLKKNKNKKFVVLDIPLLLENKINKRDDVLVYIYAQRKEINKRLFKKRGSISILRKFKKLQLPLELKKKKANFVIKNNFRNSSVKKSVRKVLKNILSNA